MVSLMWGITPPNEMRCPLFVRDESHIQHTGRKRVYYKDITLLARKTHLTMKHTGRKRVYYIGYHAPST